MKDSIYTMYIHGMSKNDELGPSGYAALIMRVESDDSFEYAYAQGSAATSTSRRMELTAILDGLSLIPEGSMLMIITKSDYVNRILNGGRTIQEIIDGGYFTLYGKKMANLDLVRPLFKKLLNYNCKTMYTKDFKSYPYLNKACDAAYLHTSNYPPKPETVMKQRIWQKPNK